MIIFAQVLILFNAIYYKEPAYDSGEQYPGWSLVLGWMIILTPILVIPGWFLYKYCTLGGWQVSRLF